MEVVVNSRQLHSHKDPGGYERHDDADKANRDEQNAIESRHERILRLVKNHKAQGADREEKARSQAFHDVLTIDSIRHEGNRS